MEDTERDTIFQGICKAIIMQTCPDEETFIVERARISADFILGEVSRLINKTKTSVDDSKLSSEFLSHIIWFFHAKLITAAVAKMLIGRVWESGENPIGIVVTENLWRISDKYEIMSIVATLCTSHEKQLQQYSEGNEKVGAALIGHLMKLTRGCADATILTEQLKDLFFYPEYNTK